MTEQSTPDTTTTEAAAPERRAALVTGGARGIGRALSLRLAQDGFDMAVNYRSGAEAAAEAVQEIQALGVRAIAVQGDVSDLEQARAAVESAIEAFGHLDVIVNNAGISKDLLLTTMEPQDWKSVMDVNFGGVFNGTKAVLDHFMSRGTGSIINISSVMGERGWVGQANYSASKGAINAFTRSSAVELARFGIRVNAVMPGFVPTELVDELVSRSGSAIRRQLPMRRFGEVEQIAGVVSFLAGDSSSYMTGECLAVDGGAAAQLGLGRPK